MVLTGSYHFLDPSPSPTGMLEYVCIGKAFEPTPFRRPT